MSPGRCVSLRFLLLCSVSRALTLPSMTTPSDVNKGISRRLVAAPIVLALGLSPVPEMASAASTDDVAVQSALRSFTRGDYESSLSSWTDLTERYPDNGLYWSNRGTVELIVGSSGATLGEMPTGKSKDLLESAVSSFDRASELGDNDQMSLNNRGNALAVLLRWKDAAGSYDDAVEAGAKAKASTSVPAANRAQVALELGDPADAERRTVSLLRKDPNFLDARALLAAVRYSRGDKDGAEESFAQLCRPTVSSPNRFSPPTKGIGGTDWCELYSTSDIVTGRWTPTAISAYNAFLKSRKASARIAADSNPFL